MEAIISNQLLNLVMIAAGTLFITELCRRIKWLALVLVALSVIMLPWWLQIGDFSFISAVKLYSVAIGTLLITLMRLNKKIGENTWAKYSCALIVVINIAELIYIDLSTFQIPQILNAIAGILLIISIRNWSKIQIDSDKDFVWPQNKLWILAYMFWNATYAFLTFTGQTAFFSLILITATISTWLHKKQNWWQNRAHTLLAYLIYFASFTALQIKYGPMPPHTYEICLGVGAISLTLSGINTFNTFRAKKTITTIKV